MTPNLKNCRAAVCLSLLTLLLATTAGVAPVFAADEAADIIAETGAFYATQSALAADVVVKLELPPQFAGMGGIPPMSYRYFYQAPVSFAFIPPAGDMVPPVVQNGKRYYCEIAMAGTGILRKSMPLASFFSEEGSRYLQHPGADIIIGLGLDSEVKGSLRSMSGIELVGDDQVDGIDCRHLVIDGPEFKGELWVAKGDKPWLMRVVQPAPPAEPASGSEMMVVPGIDLRISNWDADPEFGDVFDIEPSKTLKIRDTMPTMEELMSGAAPGGQGGPHSPHPSVDKPAPDLTLYPMDGKDVTLADLKGKVVVLDFWATWCKPCVMALPAVAKVTGELAHKGVVFYAVNQLESESLIKSFLEKKGLNLPVAMDTDASAGKAFGVRGIPHSVIIDKQGVVRKVHVGFAPGMEQMLKMEIEELLAE